MSSIKSFFQSIQKSFQGPSHSTKNVAVDVHHENIQKPFEGPINSIKNVAVDVHHENIQKPFQELSIQKPFQGPISSIKNVAVDVHHQLIDQQHLSDLLMHPRRLQANIPVEAAQKSVNDAYHNGAIDGALFGSGMASMSSGFAWFMSSLGKRHASLAAVEAAESVIPATWYGAGAAAVELGGGAALASGAPPVAAAEAIAAVAAAPAAPLILPAILFGAGLALDIAAMTHYATHPIPSVHGV
jgi:hypothetical protein